ncbi:hypothetical protein [Arthrobacter sp. A2-55]|uniref:hypothetical protein n=1 Tax=Arthrobacter sp. A2-55 TaxID=2897337 RepID=UPI0021CD5502|nr:hypothetical protein [Arthrobacter sp. A2-55]MCU6481655.1 hypothetical protein [Arthrobacter sp. A2-55]
MSNKSKYYFDRFQRFMLYAHLILGAEALCIVAVVLITKPRGVSPFFVVPISVLGLSFIAYCVAVAYFAIPFYRSLWEQRRLRKRGLPVDSTDPGPWLTTS